MKIYNTIQVDLSRKNTFKAIPAKQLDYNSRFLKIELLDNGNKYSVSDNVDVIITGTRDSETKAFSCTLEDDMIIAPLTSWMLEESGYLDCEIVLVESSTETKLSSFSFCLDVDRSLYTDEDIESDENYDLLVTLIGEVRESQIVSIVEVVDGLNHTYTVTFGDESTKQFVIKDGATGPQGPQGEPGPAGSGNVDDVKVNNLSIVNNKVANIPNASASQSGLIKIPVGCGIYQTNNDGSVKVDFPVEDIKSSTNDIAVTHGSGIYNLTFNASKYATSQSLSDKADKSYVDTELGKKQDTLTSSNAGSNITITEEDGITKINATGGGSGTSDYNQLTNKPFENLDLSQGRTLSSIDDGLYVVTATGRITTSNGMSRNIGKGTELVIITYSGVKGMTYQTGRGISYINDNMSDTDSKIDFLTTADGYAKETYVDQKVLHNYSTEEQIVGTWIDGKPIYEATLLFENLPSGNNYVTYNINVEKVIYVNSSALRSDGNTEFLIGYGNNDGYNISYWDFHTSNSILNFAIKLGASGHSYPKVWMTIQYTKTTDEVTTNE